MGHNRASSIDADEQQNGQWRIEKNRNRSGRETVRKFDMKMDLMRVHALHVFGEFMQKRKVTIKTGLWNA